MEDLSHLSSHFVGVVSVTGAPLIEEALVGYQLERPDLTWDMTYGLSSVLQPKLLSGYADFAVVNSGAALTPTQIQQYPDLIQLPLFSQQTTVIYRSQELHELFRSTDSGPTPKLAFTSLVLARIFSANITNWRDSQILALNPLLTPYLPDRPIQVVLGNRYSLTGQDALCTVFNRVDSEFPARFPCTSTSYKPPIASYGLPPITRTVYTELVESVDSNLWSIGFANVHAVKIHQTIAIADWVNPGGQRITPTLLSATISTLEVGFPLVGGKADLTLAEGPNAWPFTQYLYLQLSKTMTRGTCKQKSELVQFVIWLYSSRTAAGIAALQTSPILDAAVQTALGVQKALRTVVNCLPDTPAYTEQAVDTRQLIGLSSLRSIIPSFLELYHQYGFDQRYAFVEGTQVIAFESINKGGAGYQAAITSSPDVDVDYANHLSLPLATSSARLIYSLPKGLTFEQTGPVILDIETIGAIFGGHIGSWLDPRITRFNRRLTQALRANPSINPNMTVVLCCSAERGTLPAINILRHTLQPTAGWGSEPIAIPHPLQWDVVWNAQKQDVAFKMAEVESRTPTLVSQSPGSIGYTMMESTVVDDTKHIRIMPWRGGGLSEIPSSELDADGFYPLALNRSIQATPQNAAKCAGGANGEADLDQNAFAINQGWMDWSRTMISEQCYPVTVAVQVLLPPAYSDAVASAWTCEAGLLTLKLVRWLAESPILGPTFLANGFSRLTDNPNILKYVITRLEAMKCDDKTMLVQLPVVWSVDAIAQDIGVAWSSVGLFLVIFCFVFLVLRRLSGSEIVYISLLGCVLLFTAVFLWLHSPPSLAHCAAFNWLAQIGFTMLYLPFALKIWRVDRTLTKSLANSEKKMTKKDGKSRSSGKLTDVKLMIIIAAAVALDLILLGIVQSANGGNGFALRTSTALSNLEVHSYTHCTLASSATPAFALLTLYKLVWVLGATMMTLAHTATDGASQEMRETKQLSWSFFNLIFSAILLVGIIYILSTIGTSLMLLVSCLILWTTTVGLFSLFAPKMLYFVQERASGSADERTSMLSSVGDTTAGKGSLFQFVPITGMDRASLKLYMQALDRQILISKRRLYMLGSASDINDESDPEYSREVSFTHSRQVSTQQADASPPSMKLRGLKRAPSTSLAGPGVGGGGAEVRDHSVRISLSNNYMRRDTSKLTPTNKANVRPSSALTSSAAGPAVSFARSGSPIPDKPSAAVAPAGAVITVHRPNEATSLPPHSPDEHIRGIAQIPNLQSTSPPMHPPTSHGHSRSDSGALSGASGIISLKSALSTRSKRTAIQTNGLPPSPALSAARCSTPTSPLHTRSVTGASTPRASFTLAAGEPTIVKQSMNSPTAAPTPTSIPMPSAPTASPRTLDEAEFRIQISTPGASIRRASNG